MAKQNGKVPGTFVSEQELNQLGKLLESYRDYILSHEARLELIEGWINEYHKHYSEGTEPAQETDGISEAEAAEADEIVAAQNEPLGSSTELLDESSNDSA